MIDEFVSIISKATSAQQVKDILELAEKLWEADRKHFSGNDWNRLSRAVNNWQKKNSK